MSALARAFRAARPFPHLVLDGFLDPGQAAAVAAEFPAAARLERAGDGYLGSRGVMRDLAAAGPASRALDRRLRSPGFLRWAGEVCGEPGLVRNPRGDCGGLFQDEHGLELDPHLDVNLTVPGHRRRASLFLYLNRDWRDEWGGALCLHSAPGRPPAARVRPAPGRAVLLACREDAWHSVSPVTLPPRRRAAGRRVLIVNLYSPTRAGDAPAHHSVWLPRPLPAGFAAGRRLAPGDASALRRLLARRDRLIAGLSPADAARREPLPGRFAGGYTLKAADRVELRRLFAGRDRALRRLYARQAAALSVL
ncbi:MAG: 2OG-Fe(II) oxygenase [Elusimicrobiota bacterium]|nr:2OG-Fe(II) oxygenase [Elusimicrobiota bacterium]